MIHLIAGNTGSGKTTYALLLNKIIKLLLKKGVIELENEILKKGTLSNLKSPTKILNLWKVALNDRMPMK